VDPLEALRTLGPAELVVAGRDALTSLLLAAPRLMTIFLLLPIFSKSSIPGLVRTGVVVGMVLFVWPAVAAVYDPTTTNTLRLAALILKETLVGGVIGFAVGALFWGVEAAGFFIDNQRGAAIAGSVDPLSGSDTSPLGIFFLQAYTVYFFVSGGFLAFLGAVYDSYAVWPVLEFWPVLPQNTADFFLAVADRVMYLMLVFAGPLIIAMFVAEFGLALVSRFAPQLNVFVLAMPVKSGVALFVLVLYIPFLFQYLADTFKDLPSIFGSLYRLLQ
jgi:type III secretion protein T